MRPHHGEVNGFALRHGSIVAMLLVLVATLASCGGSQRRAERLWRQSLDRVAEGDASGAVVLLQQILDDYPDTEVAIKARDQIIVYRGLASAVENYPVRRAREVMIQVARAIEAYVAAERRAPASLDQLVPKRLRSVPSDPWNRALVYETLAKGYRLRCEGSDGTIGGVGDAADLVVVNGAFTTAAP